MVVVGSLFDLFLVVVVVVVVVVGCLLLFGGFVCFLVVGYFLFGCFVSFLIFGLCCLFGWFMLFVVCCLLFGLCLLFCCSWLVGCSVCQDRISHLGGGSIFLEAIPSARSRWEAQGFLPVAGCERKMQRLVT